MQVIAVRTFSVTPGPRSRDEGKYSGEEFLGTVLRPAYVRARAAGDTLLVDLDGTEGYASSFLEAAFGGLAREFDPTEVQAALSFKTDEEPYLEQEVRACISDARQVRQ